MPENPVCVTAHRQILSGPCPWCDRRIENGQVSAALGAPAQIRWNWTAIETSLRKDDEESRMQTVSQLGKLATSLEKVLPLLAIALNDNEPQVRRFAEFACGEVGKDVSGNQVAWLETQRDVGGIELAARVTLLGRYFGATKKAIRACRATHIYWIIEHHPDRSIAGCPEAWILRFQHSATYEPAKSLWLQQCAAHKANAAVLGNAAKFFSLNEPELAEKFYLDAQKVEPSNPEWHEGLAQLYRLSAAGGSAESRRKKARQALVELEMAEQIRSSHPAGMVTSFGRATPEESHQLQLLSRLHSLPDRARAAFDAGEYKFARQFAQECLALASSAENEEFLWNDGNAIHYSHLVLGRVELQAGNLQQAKAHLIESGKTTGSPNLGSFGPNMSLANELLEQGEWDVVLEYLDLCGKFWKSGSDKIDQWKDEITRREIPWFGANLNY
jgi:tetratricopeptide (TPR) repeat protein